MRKIILILILSIIVTNHIHSEDGYRLWLRYNLISDSFLLENYRSSLQFLQMETGSDVLESAKKELVYGLKGLLGNEILEHDSLTTDGILVVGTVGNLGSIVNKKIKNQLNNIGNEGYIISRIECDGIKKIVITANDDVGILYGVFHFLRLLQTNQQIDDIYIKSFPQIDLRILNHWDNLDRTVERGYAGFSIWDWHKLPEYIDQRYIDYARANASIGINGTVLTNVNSNALVLTDEYLLKLKALAEVFRAYGIKIFLTARFSAPMELDGLSTADPLDEEVKSWWKERVLQIYKNIPDFGGFLVKANSEGQPGPQNYGRSHADGANVLADALKPYGGVVMWRAFVYSHNIKEDRAKQAYNEFQPLDGKFRENVLLQVKNGPIDFQPREPIHPLFGAMAKTPVMMEFQITQEYLGQATNFAYLAPLYEEVLRTDTYLNGSGSEVGKIIDGSITDYSITGMAGVSNIGNDINWTGHPFAQANWYAFGRLAWNHELSSERIADEWIRMTFSNDCEFIDPVKSIMINSREVIVNYMTPLGLHHIMGWDHHYGPGPWIKDKGRADWTSVYYHQADRNGIGFDRTETGSNAVSQYLFENTSLFSSPETCPDEFLLWFHHLSWNYKMKSGNSLWDELCYHYYDGVESVNKMQLMWNKLEGFIDKERFGKVKMLLDIQYKEAVWWRNACVLYFQSFSELPVPEELEKPDKPLEYYMNLSFPYAPGIKPKW